jgi:hypothetical protein
MPTAMIVLFILVLLTGAAITVSTQTSSSTTRDNNVKAEVEAAEAGLHVADYRLTWLKPGATQCINESEAVEAKSKSEAESKCKDSAESLGNGASYAYWTSLPLAAKEKCGGRTVEEVAGSTQRCVTSEGKVNGVEPAARLQTLIASSGGEALFSIKGILGLKHVLVNGSVSVPGVVASNGEIRGEGSANFTQGFEICAPEGKFVPAAGKERNSSGVKVHGVGGMEAQPEYEKTRPAGECPIKAGLPSSHATAETNEDSRIGVQDKLTGPHHTWNAEKFEFSMEGSEKEDTLTLGEKGVATKYFFCSFKLAGGALFKIASGAKVEIYIGNSEETKKCAAKSGTIAFEGGSKTENLSKNPAALLIIVGGKGPFTYTNGGGKVLEASVYAPNAKVELSGGVEFKGGIVGSEVFLEAGSKFYEWSEETGKLTTGGTGTYSRKAWEQCSKGSGSSEGC